MYIIGLTGNIATGKSSIAAMLQKLGAYVIDADKLAHWVMRSGTDVHRRVITRFGPEILKPDGEIDRRELGALVFSDPAALRDLEAIVHPAVVAETFARLHQSAELVGVVEAIKLLEANMHAQCDAVWVVTSSREQQLDRLMRTRGLASAEAKLRIGAQAPVSTKLAHADVVIDNSRGLEDAWSQVLNAWNAIPGTPKRKDMQASEHKE